ncbi:hypothetical protein A3770_20p85190 [Chloropicon primus]|uniref:EamA domain-containing protein n=1 Tax=Chloropicon primus TaxID=1764295 RepID=A0A5B8N0C2_9CHLO|nr:hypothetical protein A3770_20p85190 [Chloropicon primus]|mmetsp:Transcript_2718/g.7457  ORF Transcript_2718/g.7457 Transcript_2718/m.7457 type:complete len:125 (+) Transcript_2718:131-505(+)|eukprot:QDZ26001.1 hypothetical protein A3770_20p85190 [Chloropicon primus]
MDGILCSAEGWTCLALSALLSSLCSFGLSSSVKEAETSRWLVLLRRPKYTLSLLGNFLFGSIVSNYCQAKGNCFPPLSTAQPALNALELAFSAVLSMTVTKEEGRDARTVLGVVLVGLGIFVLF